MRDLPIFIEEAPCLAEMVAMIIEAHASRGLLFRTHRNQQLIFECLLDLIDRQQLSGASEKRIARKIDLMWQAKLVRDALGAIDPIPSELNDLIRRTDTHIFAHPKRLQPIEMQRRFMTKAIRRNIKHITTSRHGAPRCRDRIDWVTGSRT